MEDNDRKEVWGCNGKSTMSIPTMVDEDKETIRKFWSCPIRFIPSSIHSFIKCFSFYQNHPSSPFPNIENISPRYLEAENILNSELLQNRK